MNCGKCGKENSDQDQFCTGCGAPLREASQQPRAALPLTNERVMGIVGLIAGILMLVGLFTPWVSVSGWGVSISASAWDSVTGAEVVAGGGGVDREAWAFFALFGVLFSMGGAVYALAAPKTMVSRAILGAGALCAFVGAIWALSDLPTFSGLGYSVSRGAGLYLTLLAGILGIAGAAWALWLGVRKRGTPG